MSAWTVSKAHIDAMVNSAAQLGVISTADEALTAGRMLWRENYRSVNYRYSEDESPPPYSVATTEASFDPAAIVHVLECYGYQTCESPDWNATEAYAWCEKVRVAAEATMSTSDLMVTNLTRHRFGSDAPAYQTHAAYEATPWGVESMDDIPRREPA